MIEWETSAGTQAAAAGVRKDEGTIKSCGEESELLKVVLRFGFLLSDINGKEEATGGVATVSEVRIVFGRVVSVGVAVMGVVDEKGRGKHGRTTQLGIGGRIGIGTFVRTRDGCGAGAGEERPGEIEKRKKPEYAPAGGEFS